MIPITISEEILHVCPYLHVLAVAARVVNTPSNPDLWDEIRAEEEEIRATVALEEINKWQPIAATRVAYRCFGKDPNRYRPSAESLLRRVVKGLSLYRIDSPEKDKLDTLLVLLHNLKSGLTLIFCNQRESVDRVQQFLTDRGIIAEAFHGGMEQADRERALCKFRNHSSYICISTDLAARGLDIPEVKYIIHYHLPVDLESFTHRNGRTARMHAEGEAFMIVGPTEQLPEYARQATAFRLDPTANLLQTPPMATLHFAAGKKEKISKGDIVGFLTQKGGLTADEIGLIEVKDHYCYVAVARDKAHETLHRLRDEKIKGKKVKISFSY